MNFDLAWPRGDHSLDRSSATPDSAAFYGGCETFYGRIRGFRRAAQLSFEQMMSNALDRDFLVYPFISNWRHAIELQLKELLSMAAELHHVELDGKLLRTHNLSRLWDRARPMITETPAGGASHADLTVVTRIIGQLTSMDPDGQELRYHLRNDGNPTLPEHPYIDTPAFHEALQSVSAFLEATATAVDESIKFEREIAQEFSQ